MKKVLPFIAFIGLIFIPTNQAISQSISDVNELKQQIETLKARQNALEKELAEIKNIISQNARAPMIPEGGAVISLEDAAIKGDVNAKITLIEFTDYQCPFCGRYFRETLPRIINDYVNKGKLRYVLREFPLQAIHPHAFKAAEAAGCAGDQGRYWEMHDHLFGNQNALVPDYLPSHATAIGLDVTQFKSCVESGKYTAKVRKDMADAQKAGVDGTPTFFIGLTDPKTSEIRAIKKIVGAQSYAAFQEAIDALFDAK